MSRRTRIYIGIVGLFIFVVSLLLSRVATDLDSRYRESAEESLVDAAHLLAAVVETDMQGQTIDSSRLRTALQHAYERRFEAKIFGLTKRRVDLHIYMTDANGIVLFDSTGKSEGQDFRAWRDVSKTLAGEYGARTTQVDPNRVTSAVMYVAAPIYAGKQIVGVVSIGKPIASLHELVVTARQKLIDVGLITLIGFVLLMAVISVWLVRPFGFSTDLLRVVRQEGIRHPGRLLRRLASVTAAAFNDMRDVLAGRSYTEEYVQTLTHELKSPLTAIRGAAELLREPMSDAQRLRFTTNISEQVQRLQGLADHLLELASLEKRRTLENLQTVDLHRLTHEVIAEMTPAAQRRGITLSLSAEGSAGVDGDPFLLHQAVVNLLANAIDFSPPNADVEVTVTRIDRHIALTVRDHGTGVPDYALDRAFEKFYSLPRPESGKKGTGLGLAFVREIAQLHGGEARLENHAEGGAIATLILPAIITHE